MIGRNKMSLASRVLIIFLSMLNLIIVKNNFVKKKNSGDDSSGKSGNFYK